MEKTIAKPTTDSQSTPTEKLDTWLVFYTMYMILECDEVPRGFELPKTKHDALIAFCDLFMNNTEFAEAVGSIRMLSESRTNLSRIFDRMLPDDEEEPTPENP